MRDARATTVRPALAALLALGLAAGGGCESTHEYFDVAPDSDAGTATCAEVLTCMQGCADRPCVDACAGTICPASTTTVDALMTCVDGHCATECANFADAACTTCVTGACMTEATACYSATCS
jgi:hypothetical protein